MGFTRVVWDLGNVLVHSYFLATDQRDTMGPIGPRDHEPMVVASSSMGLIGRQDHDAGFDP